MTFNGHFFDGIISWTKFILSLSCFDRIRATLRHSKSRRIRTAIMNRRGHIYISKLAPTTSV